MITFVETNFRVPIETGNDHSHDYEYYAQELDAPQTSYTPYRKAQSIRLYKLTVRVIDTIYSKEYT